MQRNILLTFLMLVISLSINAQRGIHIPYTVSASNTILNSYTTLNSDAASGNTSINVADNLLNTNYFSSVGVLSPGDLILIIQMKGVNLNGTAVSVGGGHFLGTPLDGTLGAISSYNNCGNWEYAEVTGVSGTNTIHLRCGLTFDYTSSGIVQVIRVPRFESLTINAGASVTAASWNGSQGGIVAIEVEGNTIINGTINVTGIGFRGGIRDNTTSNFGGQMAGTNAIEGGAKGESIAGYDASYATWGGMYGRAAFANGGGGGTSHNSGGGGGANAASIAWNEGLGNPASGYNAAWNLETGVNMVATYNSSLSSSTTSGGGGRGGYTHSNSNQDALALGPNQGTWGADTRRIQGGLGGRPMDYSGGRLYMAGGGGAGEMNDNDGGSGGNGGGMVLLECYGNISGSGSIQANGQDGQDSDNSSPAFGDFAGNDGAGGGGAGGTVLARAAGTITGISVSANGGAGGDNVMTAGSFGTINSTFGPGGGGGGGFISTTTTAVSRTANGGINGVTNSPQLTEFPPNGATAGSAGLTQTSTTYNITVNNPSICSGNTATLTASVTGTPPSGTLTWYSDLAGTIVGTGTSFTTPVLTANTTYYLGYCPEGYLIPADVTVTTGITIDNSSVTVTDESCGTSNGSITGITASGGSGSLSYSWDSGQTTADITGLSAGSYTLTVTDGSCTSTDGPYVISNTTGVIIDISAMVIVDENCNNAAGSITGITASGGTGTLNYSWNSGQTTADISSLSSGSYTLTVTDALSCTATAGPFTVNNIGAPTIDLSGLIVNNETCTNGNGSISGITVSGGTGTYTYQWNGSSSTINISNLSAGTYTLTVDDGTACQVNAGPFTITDEAAPVIDASAQIITDEHCGQSDGAISGLVVTGGTAPLNYDWGGASALLNPTGLPSGNYTLTITDGNLCTTTYGPVSINNIAGPVIDESAAVISNENCFSNNGSVTGILASGGTGTLTYSWNGTASPGTDLSGANAGNYTLTVTDAFGCTDVSSIFVVGYDTPPTINSSSAIITPDSCDIGLGAITGIIINGGAAPITYDWNGSPSSTADTTGLADGTYTLTITDANGCTAADGPFTITGTPSVTASISGPSSGCEGDMVTYTASGASIIYWSNGQTGSSITLPLDSAMVVTAGVSNGFCADSASITVTVDPLPVLVVGNDTISCSGQPVVISANADAPLVWETSQTTNSISVNPSGTSYYTVTATNACGSVSDSVMVTLGTNPTVDAGADQIISFGQTAQLQASGALTYTWSPASSLNCSDCSSPTAAPGTTTTYTVIGTDANGCQGTDQVTVEIETGGVAWVPNAFSPDGNGTNESIGVMGKNIENVLFRVFNRWGELVFESTTPGDAWDGTYKGELQSRATFVYSATGNFTDGKSFELNGNFTLMR
jgi:gliding motility-associated-like protein